MEKELQSMLDRLDRLAAQKDASAMEELLKAWCQRARISGALNVELTLNNEWLGLCRHTLDGERAEALSKRCQVLLNRLKREHSLEAGTTYLNCGTTLGILGLFAQAAGYYRMAGEIYRARLVGNDPRLAAYFNNYGQFLLHQGNDKAAAHAFRQAIALMESTGETMAETAVSQLNLAAALEKTDAPQAESCIQAALQCLNDPNVSQDRAYAFTLRKCAQSLAGLRHPEQADALSSRAEEIFNLLLGNKEDSTPS